MPNYIESLRKEAFYFRGKITDMARSKKSANNLLESYMGYRSKNSSKFAKFLLVAYLCIIGITFLFCAYIFSGIFGNFMGDKDSTNTGEALLFLAAGVAAFVAVFKIMKKKSKK